MGNNIPGMGGMVTTENYQVPDRMVGLGAYTVRSEKTRYAAVFLLQSFLTRKIS